MQNTTNQIHWWQLYCFYTGATKQELLILPKHLVFSGACVA